MFMTAYVLFHIFIYVFHDIFICMICYHRYENCHKNKQKHFHNNYDMKMSKYSEFKKPKRKVVIEVEEFDDEKDTFDDILEDFKFLKKKDNMHLIEDDFELQYNLKYLKETDIHAYDKYLKRVKKDKLELNIWTLPTLEQYKKNEEERIKSFSDKPYNTVKGIVSCPKCRCDEMMTFQVQTRSADEGMTAIYTCTKCNHLFSMS